MFQGRKRYECTVRPFFPGMDLEKIKNYDSTKKKITFQPPENMPEKQFFGEAERRMTTAFTKYYA
jgi:hypothetical protein